jgi:hypothetical protein
MEVYKQRGFVTDLLYECELEEMLKKRTGGGGVHATGQQGSRAAGWRGGRAAPAAQQWQQQQAHTGLGIAPVS